MITIGKLFGDHCGIGYKGETSGSKTIFVKSGLLDDSINISMNESVEKSVSIRHPVATGKSVGDLRQKWNGKNFVPIFHFCGVKGHIRSRCFALMNFLKNYHDKSIYSRYF